MYLRRIMAMVLMICLSLAVNAQEKQIELTGSVSDIVPSQHLMDNCQIILFTHDSIAVDTADNLVLVNETKDIMERLFKFEVKSAGKYFIRCSSTGYHTLEHPVEVANLKKQRYEYKVGRLTMKRRLEESSILLNEVQVKATKVKFYFKNDTLIYNASAFNTKEGAMLSELMEQLPGVKMTPEGNIFVNNRKVDVLLLNGKDFFQNDRNTILKNLPAYTIKSFKVYDHKGDSTALFSRLRKKLGYVMDVKLKKGFESLITGNTDLGIGTNDRYYGAIFGLGFTNDSRFSAQALTNNINKTYAEYAYSQTPFDARNVNFTKILIDYNLDDKKGRFSVSGDCKSFFSHSHHYKNIINTTYFYESGNIYSHNYYTGEGKAFTFITNNNIMLFGNTPYEISIESYINIYRNKSNSSIANAMFSEDVLNILGPQWQDSISADKPGYLLSKYGITRNIGNNKAANNDFSSILEINKTICGIAMSLYSDYFKNGNISYKHNTYDYLSNTEKTQKLNKYSRTDDSRFCIEYKASYTYKFTESLKLTSNYQYRYEKNDNDNPIHLLSLLEGWNDFGMNPLGTLPSKEELEAALDRDNSSWTSNTDRAHYAKFNLEYKPKKQKSFFKKFTIDVPLEHKIEKLNYRQAKTDTTVSRKTFFPKISVNIYLGKSTSFGINSKGRSANAGYSFYSSAPSLSYSLNVRNTSDPLNITENGLALKNIKTHTFKLQGDFTRPKIYYISNFQFDITENKMVWASIYDKVTGVNISRPMYTNGNWNLGISNNMDLHLDKERNTTLNCQCNFNLYNNVGFTSTSKEEMPKKKSVKNYKIKLSSNLHHKISYEKDVKAGLHVDVNRREGYNIGTITNWGFDIDVKWKLPLNVSVITDLTTNCYRGYKEKSMNTNECIMNIMFERIFLKGRLTVRTEANDLFKNRTSLYCSTNSLMHSESRKDIIGRYFMIHAIWKIMPKKKK